MPGLGESNPDRASDILTDHSSPPTGIFQPNQPCQSRDFAL